MYSLYHPLDNIPSCTSRDSVNYVSGFTYLQPITSSPPISMNPLTGYLTMYPTVCSDVSVMGVKVEEYRAGVRIGFIERDNLLIVTNQAALEVQETKEESTILISPNPFTNVVTLSSFNLDAVAEVLDILGQKLYSVQITKNKQELNLSELPNGIYFIKVETLDGIRTQKIIKQ